MPTWAKAILIGVFHHVLALLLCAVVVTVSTTVGLLIGGTDAGGWIVATFTAVALSGAISGLLGFLSSEN